MNKILHITNGDCAVKILHEAKIDGDILPWRDILHEGPVPRTTSLHELSVIRANYIAERNWGELEQIKSDFKVRDNTLEVSENYSKIVLWFEHDLYDQLQLLQLLDWFKSNNNILNKVDLSLICTDNYLGMADIAKIHQLKTQEESVSSYQIELAAMAWNAFTSDSPIELQKMLRQDLKALPFLRASICRLLEEFPALSNGLSRTANKALAIISDGEQRPGRIFGCYQKTEESWFMGDSSFWGILQQLLDASPPLLALPAGKKLTLPTSPDQVLKITHTGLSVLHGEKNWLNFHKLDQWIGGTHLTLDNLFCWDEKNNEIVKID